MKPNLKQLTTIYKTKKEVERLEILNENKKKQRFNNY